MGPRYSFLLLRSGLLLERVEHLREELVTVPCHTLAAEGLAVLERLAGAHRVHPAEGATQHQQVAEIVQLRRVAALATLVRLDVMMTIGCWVAWIVPISGMDI